MWGISVFSCGCSQAFLSQLSGGVSSGDPSALFWFYLPPDVCLYGCAHTQKPVNAGVSQRNVRCRGNGTEERPAGMGFTCQLLGTCFDI